MGTPRFVTDAAAESRHNQADAFGRAIDADTVESSLERVCRERESVDEGTNASNVGMSRNDVENTVNNQLRRTGADEFDRAVVPDGGQSVAAALSAIDDGNQVTLAIAATVRAVAGAEAGA